MELGKASGFPEIPAMTQPTFHSGVFSRRPNKSPGAYVVRSTRLRAGLAEEGGQPSELSDYVSSPADNIQATPRRFSPTRLATTLTSSLPPLPTATGVGAGSESKGEGFIVLETNYRIYAYTGPLILPRESQELGLHLAQLAFLR